MLKSTTLNIYYIQFEHYKTVKVLLFLYRASQNDTKKYLPPTNKSVQICS